MVASFTAAFIVESPYRSPFSDFVILSDTDKQVSLRNSVAHDQCLCRCYPRTNGGYLVLNQNYYRVCLRIPSFQSGTMGSLVGATVLSNPRLPQLRRHPTKILFGFRRPHRLQMNLRMPTLCLLRSSSHCCCLLFPHFPNMVQELSHPTRKVMYLPF